jgi:hypothetical protein
MLLASFWINLPFGAVALLAVHFFFHPPPRKASGLTVYQRIREIDLAGAFFLISGAIDTPTLIPSYTILIHIIAIVCLLLALQWGRCYTIFLPNLLMR